MPARIVQPGVIQERNVVGEALAEGISKGISKHFEQKATADLSACEAAYRALEKLPEEKRQIYLTSPQGQQLCKRCGRYGYSMQELVSVPLPSEERLKTEKADIERSALSKAGSKETMRDMTPAEISAMGWEKASDAGTSLIKQALDIKRRAEEARAMMYVNEETGEFLPQAGVTNEDVQWADSILDPKNIQKLTIYGQLMGAGEMSRLETPELEASSDTELLNMLSERNPALTPVFNRLKAYMLESKLPTAKEAPALAPAETITSPPGRGVLPITKPTSLLSPTTGETLRDWGKALESSLLAEREPLKRWEVGPHELSFEPTRPLVGAYQMLKRLRGALRRQALERR